MAAKKNSVFLSPEAAGSMSKTGRGRVRAGTLDTDDADMIDVEADREQTKQVAVKVDEFVKACEAKNANIADCQKKLTQIKISMLNFQLLPPFHADKKLAREQLFIARKALEHAVLLSISAKDETLFARHFAQLRAYYFDYHALLDTSQLQSPILALNLLSLLVANKLSDFHTELELIPADVQEKDKYIRFVLDIERDMMEGSYNKVLQAGTQSPFPSFNFYLSRLTETVREKIASCAEKAYENMSVVDAQKMLMLGSGAEVKGFAAQRNWSLGDAGIVFPKMARGGQDIPSQKLIHQALGYACELEKII